MNLPELAKFAVENYVEKNRTVKPSSIVNLLPEEFIQRRAGSFVTIEKKGKH